MKLIIFDLDGTLVDSLEDLADAANYAMKHFGYPVHPIEAFRYFVGNGIPKLIERCLLESERSPERIEEVRAVFSGYYNVHFADKTRPYDGIPELLDKLRSEGVRTAVASNKSDDFTHVITDSFFKGTFDAVIGSREGVPRKPAPDIVFDIMKELGADASDTYFAGDSNVDMYTAKNAGIRAIGCLWGFRTKEELLEGGADFLAENPWSIFDILFEKEK
ncbi:MAG: HAD family hydrolase [Oscillospiraceae bacterium]|nr:HAD family hydrolase [Oscillospiraceae bacterium]